MSGLTRFFTTPDGLRLAYRDEGAGMPLLCLAGLTRTMADFDDLVPHLPEGIRVIRMDARGRGQSQWADSASYTVPQEAADAVALLNHLGVERAAILGTSRGGLIGMLLCATAKARLSGLCLNDVGPVIERAGLVRIFDYLGRNPAAKTHQALAEALPRMMPGFANVPPNRWAAEARKHYVQTERGLKITYDPALREAFIKAFDGPPVDLWLLWEATSGLPVAPEFWALGSPSPQPFFQRFLRHFPHLPWNSPSGPMKARPTWAPCASPLRCKACITCCTHPKAIPMRICCSP